MLAKSWHVIKIGNLYLTGFERVDEPHVSLDPEDAYHFYTSDLEEQVQAFKLAKYFGGTALLVTMEEKPADTGLLYI